MPDETGIPAATARSASVAGEGTPEPGTHPIFVDRAPGAVLLIDRAGRVLEASAGAGELLGYPRAAMTSLTLAGLDPETGASRWPELWARAERDGHARCEATFSRRDGAPVTVELEAGLVEADGGGLACVFVRDVSERRRLAERLANMEERFEHLVEGSLQGISVDAYDNRPLFVNQAFAEVYGYESPAEILALDSLQSLVAPEDRARVEDYTRRRGRGEEAPSVYEFQAIRKDGRRITVLCSAHPVIWEGVPAVQASVLDITERTRMKNEQRAREASRARLVAAMEASSEGFALFDAEDRLYYSNQRYAEMNCAIADLLKRGTTFLEIIEASVYRGAVPEAAGNESEWIKARLAQHHHPAEFIERYRADSGLWVRIQEQKLPDGDIFVITSDITPLKESERALAEKTAELQAAYDNMDQGIIMVDDDYRIVAFNQRLAENTSRQGIEVKPGLPIREVWERSARKGLYGEGDVDALVEERMKLVQDAKPYRFIVEHSDGSFVEVRGRPTSTGGHVITHTDITETHSLSRELTYQATHDALTGLANRSHFESTLEELLADARRDKAHALCYLDLDQFKVINDTCGHLAGDELLRQLGGILPEQVRKEDMVARLGGDEFGILLEHCAIDDATRIAAKLRDAVEEFRFVWRGKIFRIGTSIGVVPVDRYNESVSDILSNVDTACYAAKDEGGNRVHVYHPDDTELARRRGDMQWVADINRSLEQDDLVLYRQPILNLADPEDDEERFEVLLRLKDTDGNIYEPGSFMRSAERFGLMGKLDRWVVSTMLEWLDALEARGAGRSMYFINISGISLRDDAFRGFLIGRLQDCDWTRIRICLEITETAAVASLANTAQFIEDVRDLGHSCALDDFGSGLSSFAYLRNLPVDYLKIDGQFVRDIDHDPIDLAMVKSITEVAQVMGKRTIAECAETLRVMEHLRAIGVHFAQGFAIDHPRPLDM